VAGLRDRRIRFSYSTFMYVSIVLGGIAFGVPGGLLAAIAGGLLLGPIMPITPTPARCRSRSTGVSNRVLFLHRRVGRNLAQLLRDTCASSSGCTSTTRTRGCSI